jgi:hypothetical protein
MPSFLRVAPLFLLAACADFQLPADTQSAPLNEVESVESELATRTVGRFGLSVDGVFLGYVESVEGGTTFGTVAVSGTNKFISKVAVEPLTLELGYVPPPTLLTAMTQMIAGTGRAYALNVFETDLNFKVIESRSFTNARLTKFAFAPLDSASKERVKLALTFQADSARDETPSGNGPAAPATKTLYAGYYTFSLQGFATNRVSRIEAFAFQRPVGGALQLPDLKFTFATIDAAAYKVWLREMSITPTTPREVPGTVVLMSPTFAPLLTLSFNRAGIFGLRRTNTTSSTDPSRHEAEVYLEDGRFSSP